MITGYSEFHNSPTTLFSCVEMLGGIIVGYGCIMAGIKAGYFVFVGIFKRETERIHSETRELVLEALFFLEESSKRPLAM